MAITRILTPVKVQRFCVYDLEWHPQRLELRLLGLFDGNRYRSFLHVEDFLSHVLTAQYENMWLFAHWGGATDITFFLDWFHKNGFHVDLRFSGSSAVFCEVSRGRRKWKFVDSFFLLRAPLRKIMEKLGMAKGGAEGDQDVFVSSLPELTEYNENDCRGLHMAVSRFQDRMLSMGTEMCPTIASTGMRLFRRLYLKADIPTDDAKNLIARKAYVASRVEVFCKYMEEAWQFDINSSFPSSMILPAPGAFLGNAKHVPKDGDLFFADVSFTVPVCDFPPLPMRIGGKVFFPIGSWRQWVCGADFRVLEKYARVEKVHEVHLYDGRDDMAGYVTDIYEHRRQSQDEFDREIDKLLMNALYGKWAERTEKSTIVMGGEHDIAWYEANGIEAAEIFPGAIRIIENRAIDHEHVPFSAHITAHSREKILTLLLKAKDAAYCDSVTGDRTVVVRSPEKLTHVVSVERLWEKGAPIARGDKKEAVTMEGWEALAQDASGTSGWFPLSGIVRHQAGKELWRVSDNRGQTEVTSDHGIMVGGVPTSPEAFVKKDLSFEKISAMPGVRRKGIDLLPFLDHFTLRPYRENGPRRGFVADGGRVRLQGAGVRASESAICRYRSGSEEFHALLRLLGAHISEGSVSLRGVTSVRNLWSIAQKDRAWVDALERDLRVIATSGAKVIDAGSGMWALRSGAMFLPAFFGALCGIGSRGVRLPSFIYDLSDVDFAVFWGKLVEGDGSIHEATGQVSYTTISQELAAGLSYALDQRGIEHAIRYRPNKKCWTLRTRPSGSERKRNRRTVERSSPDRSRWVYDLSVEGAHTFVDGIGRVLLHNTDSLTTKADLPTSGSLGDIKLEKFVHSGEYHAPKFYCTDGTEFKIWEPEAPGDRPPPDAELHGGSWYTKKKRSILVKAKGFSKILDGEVIQRVDGSSYRKQKKLSREDFRALIAHGTVEMERMTRPKEMLRRYAMAIKKGKKSRLAPSLMLIEKQLQTYEQKREFSEDGRKSRPFTVTELVNKYGVEGDAPAGGE